MKTLNLVLKLILAIVSLTIIEFYWPTLNVWVAPVVITLLALDFKRKDKLHWLFIAALVITVFPELQVKILGPLQIHHALLLLIALFVVPDWLSRKIKIPALNKIVISFLVVALGLTLINFTNITSWHRLLTMGYMFLITVLTPFMITKIGRAKQLFAGLWVAGLATGALALGALYLAVMTDTYFTNPYLHISTTEGVPRLAGTLLDSNFLGHFLLIILPLGFIYLIFKKRGEAKPSTTFLFAAGLVFLLAVFFLTYSRSAYLGLSAALLLVLTIFGTKKNWLLSLSKVVSLGVLGLVLAALLYPSFIFFSVYRIPDKILPSTIKTKILGDFDPTRLVNDYRRKLQNDPSLTQEQRERLLARDVSSDSLGYRLSFWRAGLAMFRDHPWTGVGVGQFRYNYAKYGSSQYLQFPDAHNIFIETLAELGLPGLTLLLLIIITAFINLARVIKKEQGNIKIIAGAVLASLAAILTQSLLLGGLGAVNIYILLGLAAALPLMRQTSTLQS